MTYSGASTQKITMLMLVLGLALLTQSASAQAANYSTNCMACVNATYSFCTDNVCRNSSQISANSSLSAMCAVNYRQCVMTSANKYVNLTYTINKQAITKILDGSIMPGQFTQLNITSDFTNNAFINLTYPNGLASGSQILFYAFAPIS